MGDFVVKAAPDSDLFLIWSTVVDAPTCVGTGDQIAAHLWTQWRRQHPDCIPKPGKGPAARMARAHTAGTSAVEPEGAYGWSDEEFIVMEAAPHDGWFYVLPRANLVAYAEALLADDDAAAHALLRRTQRIEGGG